MFYVITVKRHIQGVSTKMYTKANKCQVFQKVKYAKQSKAIAEGKADRYYGGRAKGGLMEKEVKQPKQMRSGGLASKK